MKTQMLDMDKINLDETKDTWFQRLKNKVSRWWYRRTYPIRRRIFGYYPKVNWERGGMYLFNFDQSLAHVIRDGLVAFKKYNCAVLHVENGENKTDWMLDEIIWTFDTLANGGASALPDVEDLYDKAFANVSREIVTRDDGSRVWKSVGIDKEFLEEAKKLEKLHQERINRGLKFFIDVYEWLWL